MRTSPVTYFDGGRSSQIRRLWDIVCGFVLGVQLFV